jgi:hypothetical protein
MGSMGGLNETGGTLGDDTGGDGDAGGEYSVDYTSVAGVAGGGSAAEVSSRSLTAAGITEPARIWCLTVEIHSAHGLQLSNRDSWRVAYTLLRSRVSSDGVSPGPSLRMPLEFNTCDHFHLRAPASAVHTYLHWFPSLDVSVTCATRGGASGTARITIGGLLARGGGAEGAVEIRESGEGGGGGGGGGGDIGGLTAGTDSSAGGGGIGGGGGDDSSGVGAGGSGSGGGGGGGGGSSRPGRGNGIGSGEADGPWMSYSVSISPVDPATLSRRPIDPESGLPEDIVVDLEIECGIEVLRVDDEDGDDLKDALVETGGRSTPQQRREDAGRVLLPPQRAQPIVAPTLPSTLDDDDDDDEDNDEDNSDASERSRHLDEC